MSLEEPPLPGRRWHRFHHHTAELELQLGAVSMAGLFVEAANALGELLRVEATEGESLVERTIGLEARDTEALLVAWMNELIFLVETELWVPLEVEVVEVSAQAVRARCRGRYIDETPTLVKAATYHGLKIEGSDGELRASVILDV